MAPALVWALAAGGTPRGQWPGGVEVLVVLAVLADLVVELEVVGVVVELDLEGGESDVEVGLVEAGSVVVPPELHPARIRHAATRAAHRPPA